MLGSILFLLFINDICDVFIDLNVKCKLFADDLKLYAKRANADSAADDLSLALKRIELWCDEWQLHLAIDKCFVLQLRPWHSCTPPPNYKLYDKSLKICDSVKDLGVTIDFRLNFAEHISNITRKALIRCRLIIKSFHSKNSDLLIKAFVTYVRPLLEYASSIWSPHHQNLITKVEKVQRFFTKRVRGMWNLSYEQRLSTLKLQSLQKRRTVSDLSSVTKFSMAASIRLCLMS